MVTTTDLFESAVNISQEFLVGGGAEDCHLMSSHGQGSSNQGKVRSETEYGFNVRCFESLSG